MHYGGIYLDNDVFVANSLDEYRNYEMTISWDKEKNFSGNMVFSFSFSFLFYFFFLLCLFFLIYFNAILNNTHCILFLDINSS
jgi:hypothetical protein